MQNPLLALFAAVCTMLLPEGLNPMASMTQQPTISISPDPPQRGGQVTIYYDGPLPITLELDWDPEAFPKSVTIDTSAGATVTVPSDASSLIVRDPTGAADAVATTISR